VAVVSRAMRPAPFRSRSAGAGKAVSATRPSAEKSRSSMILGAPGLVVINPGTPGSMPLSRIAISTPGQLDVGCGGRSASTPVLWGGIGRSGNAEAGPPAGSAARLPSDGAALTAGGAAVGVLGGGPAAGLVRPLLEAQAVARAKTRKNG